MDSPGLMLAVSFVADFAFLAMGLLLVISGQHSIQFDAVPLGLLRLGQRQFQDAILEARFRLGAIHVGGQRHHAVVGTSRNFVTVVIALFFLLLMPCGALDR